MFQLLLVGIVASERRKAQVVVLFHYDISRFTKAL